MRHECGEFTSMTSDEITNFFMLFQLLLTLFLLLVYLLVHA